MANKYSVYYHSCLSKLISRIINSSGFYLSPECSLNFLSSLYIPLACLGWERDLEMTWNSRWFIFYMIFNFFKCDDNLCNPKDNPFRDSTISIYSIMFTKSEKIHCTEKDSWYDFLWQCENDSMQVQV